VRVAHSDSRPDATCGDDADAGALANSRANDKGARICAADEPAS
jgi:hypothetical protein